MLAEKLLDCYAAANKTPYLMVEGGGIHNAKNADNEIIQRPFLRSISESTDKFLSVCYQTESAIQKYSKNITPYKRAILRTLEDYGSKNSHYRVFNKLYSKGMSISFPQYSRDKKKVIYELSDVMFQVDSELFKALERDVNKEKDENYHNVEKLLSVFQKCQNIQNRKLRFLRSYDEASNELSEDERFALANISDDISVNNEILLHIKVSLEILKKISITWYSMICRNYHIYANQSIPNVRIVESQLEQAKSHLSLLLWGEIGGEVI